VGEERGTGMVGEVSLNKLNSCLSAVTQKTPKSRGLSLEKFISPDISIFVPMLLPRVVPNFSPENKNQAHPTLVTFDERQYQLRLPAHRWSQISYFFVSFSAAHSSAHFCLHAALHLRVRYLMFDDLLPLIRYDVPLFTVAFRTVWTHYQASWTQSHGS
jgi:hypothetical protein